MSIRAARPSGLLLAAGVGLVACSDSLVGSGYHGEPLFQIEGRIVDDDGTSPDLSRPTASLFWSLTGETTTDPREMVAQDSVAVGVEFPATFTFKVFERPDVPSRRDAAYLVGLIVLHEDRDGDGAYSEDELQGGAFENVVLYADEPVEAGRSPTRLPLPRGFSVADLPLPCDGVPPDLSGEDCGVPLGAPCGSDLDCGAGGRCLTTDGEVPYPDGYCVLPDDAGCVPEGGVLLDLVNPFGEVTELVWAQGCLVPTDCRDRGYTCALDVAACVPALPVAIFVTRDFVFCPLCGDL
jgi:hypothetical protein